MQNEFTRTLNRLLAESGKSVTQVSALGGIDRAYLSRLLDGSKRNPSDETLMRIWIGLCMDPEVVKRHPDFVHGLVYLLHSSAMSNAPSKLAGD